MYKILVVDDEEMIRRLITKYAAFEGHSVVEAADGMQAVQMCREGEYDILIIDIMMPELDGLRATARLREESNVPIILLTAKSEDTDKIMGLNIGADDYMSKPLSMREVKARVKAVLRRSNKLKNIVEEVEDRECEISVEDAKKINAEFQLR